MRKKSLSLLSVSLVMTLALSACGGNNANNTANNAGKATNEGSGNTAPSTAKATKVEFWTFQQLHAEFYTEMVKRWNTANPDKTIELVANVSPYDDVHNKLLVALQSGSGAPDFADIEISKFPNYIKGEPQLVPLNDIVEPDLDNLVKARFDIYAKDGNYYGIDYHVGASVIYYNKEILDKAGVNADDIKTWDDFAKAGKVVLDKTGIPMTTLETSEQWSMWLQTAQLPSKDDLLKADGTPNLDGPEVTQVMKWQQEQMKSGVAVGAPGGFHHAEEYFGFMGKGGAASVWMPLWYMGRFTDSMPDLKGKMIIRPMPAWSTGEPRSAGMGGTATVITKQTKSEDLVKQFLSFAKLSKEGSIATWTILGFDPLRSDVWDDEAMKAPNKFTEYFGNNIFDVLTEVKDEIEGINIGEKTPQVIDAIKTQSNVRILLDNEDTEKVLKDVNSGL
ncbi:ABC transporter substrate-binding protein [Paenibacillus wynnii]|uniref:ABC transporter substrate-binding protein n=1 Tax=Paenibacillus wynnii TaxID=268407 RepID=UPI002792DD19|nr:ABC transporter substrate-binding protein [Paenibacillus wynnii]MDQ0192019.1 arabinosaccharide transport system substrate-binding protein [Paenibacillus wynnii]